MKKINKITIQNFKAFPDLQTFGLNGKNLLVHGNNGSGKSSLYWALYTFLQCSEKDTDEINKYFVPFNDAIEDTYQSLRNIYRPEDDDSFIKIELQGESPIKLAYDNFLDVQSSDIQEANKASDFINYKLLHNFYNNTHKKHLNVWNVFRRDFYPYLQYRSKSYHDWLGEIYHDLPKYPESDGGRYYRRNSWMYASFKDKINNFNNEIINLLNSINHQANKVLKDKFRINDIEIFLEYIKVLTWDEDWDRSFNSPEIKLSIKYQKDGNIHTNHRPQSFLNEASLTRIAISIRLGALLTRLATSEWKILVLDDMLISLDMSNRMIVSEIILNDEDLRDFQKIILTHDKSFFDILRNKTDSTEWNYLEFQKDEKNNSSRPIIKPNKTYLEKAKEFFEEKEFDACANYLRKESESILRKYLNKDLTGIESDFESLSNLINQAKTQVEHEQLYRFQKILHKKGLPFDKLNEDFESDGSIDANITGRLRGLKKDLIQFAIQENKRNTKAEHILNELNSIKKRILNPGSHGNSMPYYEQELKEAIEIVEKMYILLNSNEIGT